MCGEATDNGGNESRRAISRLSLASRVKCSSITACSTPNQLSRRSLSSTRSRVLSEYIKEENESYMIVKRELIVWRVNSR